jgi:hypothetical protein
VRAADATHYYEGLTRPRDIVNHEVRLLIGTVLNAYLCWDTLLFMTPRDGPGAGEQIRRLNQADPAWYRRMMSNQIAIRGRRVISLDYVWRALPTWRALPLRGKLAKLPATIALAAFDAIVRWHANRKLVSGSAVGHW